MTVGMDLLLLAIDRSLHVVRERQQVVYGVMSADFIELAAAGRVEVAGKRWSARIHVTDPRLTGDPLLDVALAALAAARRAPDPVDWARQKLRQRVLDDYLAVLAAQGTVDLYSRRITRQITVTEAALLDPGRQAQVRERVDRFVVSGGPVEPLDWALAGLLYECGLGEILYPGRANRDAYGVLKEAARGDRGKGSGDPVDVAIRAGVRATRFGGNDGIGP